MAQQDNRIPPQEKVNAETDQFVAGPGVVGTKSQARGSIGGVFVGGIVGAVVGVVIGLIFFGGAVGIIISAICFTIAGATAGGVAGGSVNPRRQVGPAGTDD